MQKFKKALKGKFLATAAATGTVLASAPAFAGGAGGVDVGDVVSAITAAAGPVSAIGAAVLTIMVGIKVYKWVRRAM